MRIIFSSIILPSSASVTRPNAPDRDRVIIPPSGGAAADAIEDRIEGSPPPGLRWSSRSMLLTG
jgi:hypothetical protein